MTHFDRRAFIGASVGAAATWSAVTAAESATPQAAADVPAPPMITLGNTGIKMSRLGQGTGVSGGRRQSEQTRMGFEKLVELFHHAWARGIRFYDLADLYGTHVYFREALRTLKRDELTILTKLWWRDDGPEDRTSEAWRQQACHSAVERFMQEITTDRLDVVLLHCLMDDKWPEKMQPYMKALDDEKKRGRVRAVGVSCHDFGALKTAAAEPWVDVILARVNPKGVKMDASSEEVVAVLRQAKAAGKAIIGMKIFGEGALADQREACMKFAQGLEFLDAMTIGFETPDQIDDALRLMAKHPHAAAAKV
ncbi:MAG: aldo/keto reductase [Planctomycetota bacterium]|nr:MAG: aldo/keto reductase [Planctomycetota bacterium]